MSVKIRLSRGGTKKRPYFYIVVADSASPRDGRYIEQIGTHNPLLPKDSADRVKLDLERAKHWLAVGAQPTDRVMRFLDAAGLAKRTAEQQSQQSQTKEKAPGARSRCRRGGGQESRSRRSQARLSCAVAEDKPARILLGRIAGAHGIRGEVLIHSYAEAPQDIAAYGPLGDADGAKTFTITRAKLTGKGVVARLAGISDRDAAERLKGVELYVRRDRLPPPAEGEYYHADLIGLTAIDPAGRAFGARYRGPQLRRR